MAKTIDYFSYNNKFISVKTAFSMRARKRMFDLFWKELAPQESDEVLDLGTTPDIILEDSNLFDKMYPYKEKITAASIENCSDIVSALHLKRYVKNEAKKPLPFKNKEFDLLFCSAVLEHVGGHADQEFFINECLRVSKKVFLTTPYRYFPLEMHTFFPFLHWLPWNVFQRIVRITKGEFWADENNLMLCSKKDILRMNLSNPVKINFVRILGMKSNMIIIGSDYE